jgi:tight adherence protein B
VSVVDTKIRLSLREGDALMDMTMILIIGGGIILVLIVIGLVVSSQEERRLVDDRLGRYTEEDGAAAKAERSTVVSDWVNTQATKFTWGQGISKDLARADIKLRVGEYILVVLLAVLGVGLIAWWFGGREILSALIGAAVGFMIPRIYVGREQTARLRRFDGQLGDMLNLMVNGLRAGYSTMQAMEAVSRELPPPISDEFRRVVQEMQLGVPMERALDNLTRRIPSRDLDLVVTAVNVQREVGGNLSEILDTISHTIRERVRIKGEIRVLTSQVMTSGKFLAVMPVFLAGTLYFVNREYIMHFFDVETRFIGIPLLFAAAGLIGFGYFVMTRIANIEV